MTQPSTITPTWSARHRKVLYRLTVDGKSGALIFNADELAQLRNRIDAALEGTDHDSNITST
ncbi:hypothetical protein R1X32_17130 [Rhodococcus opacus]|uniref:hypothetical protein n=1 Tax=Rhodococcus opacus TaxID=37919 RepID=UPI0006BB4CCF|nr:hypothetical protein [Rhodococcus opacus]WKN58390.1 hypothetical protein HJ581_0033995 [Rhodococcus opacus]